MAFPPDRPGPSPNMMMNGSTGPLPGPRMMYPGNKEPEMFPGPEIDLSAMERPPPRAGMLKQDMDTHPVNREHQLPSMRAMMPPPMYNPMLSMHPMPMMYPQSWTDASRMLRQCTHCYAWKNLEHYQGIYYHKCDSSLLCALSDSSPFLGKSTCLQCLPPKKPRIQKTTHLQRPTMKTIALVSAAF